MKRLLLLIVILCLIGRAAFAQPTAFTYQGYLTDSGTVADGSYDFELTLYNVVTGGTAISDEALEPDGIAQAFELSMVAKKGAPNQAPKAPPWDGFWVGDHYFLRMGELL